MLKVTNVRKSFGNLEILKGVDLDVNQGDVVAVLGPSGSGKTTLLRCVNFLEQADQGTMVFDGETFEMGKMARRDIARIRKKTAFVFQGYNLFLNKTALQNVTEGLIVARKMPKNQALDIARRALDKVGMGDRADHYPNQLSGGQQQRVSIGRALMNAPAVVLADEPTGNLDSKNSQEIVDLLKFSNRRYDQTLIVITHDESIALQADRIIAIEDGKIARDEVLRP